MARSHCAWWLAVFLQSRESGKSILSQVSVSFVNGHAMSRVWLDAGMLSTGAPAPRRSVQAESALHADAAVHCLWVSRIHEERDNWSTAAASVCPVVLPLDVARADDLFLDLSQYAVVPICVLNVSKHSVRSAESKRSPTRPRFSLSSAATAKTRPLQR